MREQTMECLHCLQLFSNPSALGIFLGLDHLNIDSEIQLLQVLEKFN
jgi:hypothetical protein